MIHELSDDKALPEPPLTFTGLRTYVRTYVLFVCAPSDQRRKRTLTQSASPATSSIASELNDEWISQQCFDTYQHKTQYGQTDYQENPDVLITALTLR